MSKYDELTFAHTMVNILNDLYEADPEAADALIKFSTPSNLLDHPDFVVREDCSIGFLGVINSVLDSESRVVSMRDGDGKLLGFKMVQAKTQEVSWITTTPTLIMTGE